MTMFPSSASVESQVNAHSKPVNAVVPAISRSFHSRTAIAVRSKIITMEVSRDERIFKP
jgi:hypothetical protein